jgi:hypothetical protein
MKMNKNLTAISSIIIYLAACSPPQRPQASLLDYPQISVPETHEQQYQSVLDSSYNTDASINDGRLFNLPEGSRIIPIREGGISPVTGVVFNTVAAAGLEVEIRAQQRVCEVNSLYERQQLAAAAIRDIESLRNTISTQQRSYMLLIENRNRTIREYENYSMSLRRQTDGEIGRIVGFTFGGIAVGAITTGLILGFIPRN